MLSSLLCPREFTATSAPRSCVYLVLGSRLPLQLLLLQFSFEHDHLDFEFLGLTDFFIVGMQLVIGHTLNRDLRQHF
jgi:hypothetical protein